MRTPVDPYSKQQIVDRDSTWISRTVFWFKKTPPYVFLFTCHVYSVPGVSMHGV